MRILFLSQLVPYPIDAGPKVRSYHVLQYLAGRGHEVTLLAFCRPDDRPEALAHLRTFCKAVYTTPMVRSRLRDVGYLLRAMIGRQPFLILRDHVQMMHTLLSELLATEEYDAVHADQLWMAQYALAAGQVDSGKQPALVLDQHNAVHMIPQRMAAGSKNRLKQALLAREAQQLAHYEVECCRRFKHVVWVTEDDWRAVQKLNREAPFTNHNQVIPICVDVDEKPVVNSAPQPFRVTFVGGLHWPPNAEGVSWFYQQVWPQVSAGCPWAKLTIIGKQPPKAVAAPSAEDGKVEVTGYVADLERYLQETAVFIVPLLAGGGMRVKILDAWSWGLPIVSTTIGAEGLRYQAGEDILLADSPDGFGRAVLQALTDPQTAAKLRRLGRRTVERDYDWRTIYPQWDQIYGD